MTIPGIVVSALRGGAGKSILSIGITAALKNQGKSVAPFKKGPDYIDTGWLALAAGRPCYNLDTFLISEDQVTSSFLHHTENTDIAVVEGNRGLFDGIDIDGKTSTAEIAKLLGLPVILCVDGSKTTRTMAAAVSGCINFDTETRIKGVILNRVAGKRHENILRNSIEHFCGIPVLGAVPKLREHDFPERHMGLVPTFEHDWAKESVEAAAAIASKYIDLNALFSVAKQTSPKNNLPSNKKDNETCPITEDAPRIGIIKDSAFQFYYPENIEALEGAGSKTVFLNALTDSSIKDVDALYIGGGFPETHAESLSENSSFREEIKTCVNRGLPVYAECGGLMYLGEKLVMKGKEYPMTGVLPAVFGLSKKPVGHGYTISVVDRENPFFAIGTEIRGHEFRYSTVLEWRGKGESFVFETKRGKGFTDKRDGICYKSVLATYTHIHALGTPSWANAMVKAARGFKEKKNGRKL
jgi:cobyrinic acid a,c-diamide synthase